MNTSLRRHCSLRHAVLAALIGFSLAAASCQSDKHRMAEPTSGTSMACRECYDTVTEWRSMLPRPGGAVHAIRTHHCTGCKTDMTLYDKDGVLMVKCPHCAPDGVACDRCLPPQRSSN